MTCDTGSLKIRQNARGWYYARTALLYTPLIKDNIYGPPFIARFCLVSRAVASSVYPASTLDDVVGFLLQRLDRAQLFLLAHANGPQTSDSRLNLVEHAAKLPLDLLLTFRSQFSLQGLQSVIRRRVFLVRQLRQEFAEVFVLSHYGSFRAHLGVVDGLGCRENLVAVLLEAFRDLSTVFRRQGFDLLAELQGSLTLVKTKEIAAGGHESHLLQFHSLLPLG